MKDRGIYEAGKPFLMEVVFDGDDINEETDKRFRNEEIRLSGFEW